MAKLLSLNGIQTGLPVEAHHVSQSILAFRGLEAYDITVSGSMNINGITYPFVDGVSGEVLMTDGAGNATFQPVFTTASYITSSRVDGPWGMDSILSSSWAATASYAHFATQASSSIYALRADFADSSTSSSYALTASYIEQKASEKFCFTGQTTIPVVHGLGSESVVVQAYEEDPITGKLELTIPDNIVIDSNNQVTVTFARPTTGCITISGGGFLSSGSIKTAESASYAASVPNALTEGTGINAFSYNGAAAQTVSINQTYVHPSSSYALTASHALNVPDIAESASYISSSNVDGPFGFDSIQTASYAVTASYIDLAETKRFDFFNKSAVTVPHSLDSENVFIQVYRDDASTIYPTKIIPTSIQLVDNNNAIVTFSGPTTGFIIAGQSGFIRGGIVENAVSSSYALTASYALNGGGGSDIDTGSFYLSSSISNNIISFERGDGTFHNKTIVSSSYAVSASYAVTASHLEGLIPAHREDFINVSNYVATHGFDTEDVIVQVYESGSGLVSQILPDDIIISSTNQVTLEFARNTTGYVVITRGGFVQAGVVENAVTASYVARTNRTLSQGLGIEAFNFDGSADRIVTLDTSSTHFTDGVDKARAADTGSFVIASSISGINQTFTKGDGSTYLNIIESASYSETSSHSIYAKEASRVTISVFNDDAVPLAKGDPVYLEEYNGTFYRIAKADASDPNKLPAIAVLDENLALGSTGIAVVVGEVSGLNTFGFTEGRNIYVAAGGGWTQTKPTGTNGVQPIGVLANESGFDGRLYINGPISTLSAETIDTGSFVLTSSIAGFTQSFTKGDGSTYENYIDSASYAVTASHALEAITASYAISASHIIGSTFRADVTGANTYTVLHNLDSEFPIVQTYNATNREQMLPDRIVSINNNSIRVDFATLFTGTIIVKK